MYFIVKHKDSLPSDPKVRKAAADAWDHAGSLPLRDAAKLRRDIMKRKRLEMSAGRADLAEISIERMRAIRRNMEQRING